MELIEIKTGTILELEVFNESGERINPTFKSKFINAIDDKKAVIDAPIYAGILYPVHINSEMFVFFITDKNFYRFRAKTVGRSKTDYSAFLEIEKLTDIIKVQRRQHFRFVCSVPVRYRIHNPNGKNKGKIKPMNDAYTGDLSGGGLLLKTDEKIDVNTLLECELKLNDEDIVDFIGKVVRSEKEALPNSNYKYKIGVEYKKIENRNKERIIKYIFSEQTRMLRKGLS